MSDTGFDADKIRQELAKAVQDHKGWFWFTGLLSIALGTVAILIPVVFTIAAEIFIGWLFLIGGILQSFQVFRTKGTRDFLGTGVRALLAVVVGVLLLLFTGQGVIALTVLLIAFFAAEGITRIVMAFKLRPEKGVGLVPARRHRQCGIRRPGVGHFPRQRRLDLGPLGRHRHDLLWLVDDLLGHQCRQATAGRERFVLRAGLVLQISIWL